MKIKKVGHCCLIIETNNLKIMTDPGNFSIEQNQEKDVDVVLITHEHADHFHLESLLEVIKNNPQCRIITNTSVKKLLDKENIACEILDENEIDVGVKIFAKTCPHADIFDGIIPVQNTGYLIDDKLFYPGDAWLLSEKEVEVLALPVAGPWSKIRDSIEYAVKINPKIAFPVHDGIIKDSAINIFHKFPEKFLNEKNIHFKTLEAGEILEI